MLKIKLIGLGGIGTILGKVLFQFLHYYIRDELSEEALGEINTIGGTPQRFDEIDITLIDGDEYEPGNRSRQTFSVVGPKAEVKERDFRDDFGRLTFHTINEYVNEDNIFRIIEENDVVLLCVDNHDTRSLVNKYCQTLNNVRLYAGGNSYHTSSVQSYWRRNGVDIKPNISKYHYEIAQGDGLHPEKLGCEELHSVAPQLLFANVAAAKPMWDLFYMEVILGIDTGISDLYFDMRSCQTLAKKWKP